RRRGAAGHRGLGRAARASGGRADADRDAGRAHGRSPVPRSGGLPAGRRPMKRSKAPELVVGLDVGTTKVCAIITEPAPRGSLTVIGVGSAPSRGIKRGIVVNIDSTVEAIRAAVAEAEQMAAVEISGAFAGIAGGHIRGVNSRGVVGITGKHHEVSDADVERVIEAARAINLPQDREIIHVLPQSFLLDD